MKSVLKKYCHIVTRYPDTVQILLLCSMLRAISTFTILPFLPIYLHKMISLDMQSIGYMMGICLFFGTMSSVYAGYLSDKFNRIYLMSFLACLMMILYFTIPLSTNIIIILIYLILLNTASSSFSVTCNAFFSDLLPPEDRNKAFSLRYSLENIGAATGPLLGAWFVHYNLNFPFFLSGSFALIILIILVIFSNRFVSVYKTTKKEIQTLNFRKTLKILHLDSRLVYFTLGGILSMAVYGPLLTYLSQYLVVLKKPEVAYQTIAYISAVNAIIVISLQYIVGSRLKIETLMKWVVFGILAFIVGLFIMSFTIQPLPWMIAIAIFTIGEIIIVPAEYMFIDAIAPEHLKGVYFGAQNLIFLGMALGPMICGVLLDNTMPNTMFYVLILITLLSGICYYIGCQKKSVNSLSISINNNTIT